MIEKEEKLYEYIHYEKDRRIAYVTIDRPEVLNAISPPTKAELNSVFADFVADEDLWVAIITGAGERSFCAGADLKYRVNEEDEHELRNPGTRQPWALDECLKPVIAAVNGYAVGGGLEMAMRCDIIIAAQHARFGLPEPKRGLLSDTGGVLKLPRRIPYHLAMELILTGKLVSAQEAYRMGLVNEVVPLADLMPTAKRWADEILECAPLSLRAAKELIMRVGDLPMAVGVSSIESLHSVRKLRDSDDYTEGPKAFAEKRKPIWKGR